MTDPVLKPFTPPDAPQAASVHKACFAHDPWPAHAFVSLLETGATGFIAEIEHEAIGLILCRAASDEAEILTFAVMPDYRHKGIGSQLLYATIKSLKDTNITRLLLEVAKDNQPAISLYSRAGFISVGERSGYYPGPQGIADAYIMSKSL